jgi:hypothetical protein
MYLLSSVLSVERYYNVKRTVAVSFKQVLSARISRMWGKSISTLMATQSRRIYSLQIAFFSSQYVVEWPMNGSKAVRTYLSYTLSYFSSKWLA